jgi:signal peptidase I
VQRIVRRALVLCAVALALGGTAAHVLLGFGASLVLSDSMAPTFSRGDLVVTRLVVVEAIQVGDVPALVPPDHTDTYVHRIATRTRTVDGGVVITTRGDANPAPDAWTALLDGGERVPVVVAQLPAPAVLTRLAADPLLRIAGIALLGLFATALAAREVLVPSTSEEPASACSLLEGSP